MNDSVLQGKLIDIHLAVKTALLDLQIKSRARSGESRLGIILGQGRALETAQRRLSADGITRIALVDRHHVA